MNTQSGELVTERLETLLTAQAGSYRLRAIQRPGASSDPTRPSPRASAWRRCSPPKRVRVLSHAAIELVFLVFWAADERILHPLPLGECLGRPRRALDEKPRDSCDNYLDIYR